MEAQTAHDIVRVTFAAHDAAEPLRRYLDAEADALLRTLRLWVMKANLHIGEDAGTVALEVLSQVTIEAIRSADRFDPSRSPKAWLLGIAANVIKRRRSERAKRTAHEIVASALDDDADEPERDGAVFDQMADLATAAPEDSALAAEGADGLLALVAPEDRRVLRLALIGGLDGPGLAQALGVAPGTARVRLHRALARLRTAHAATREGDARHG